MILSSGTSAMTRRLISAVLLALATIIGGCSDQRAANLPAFEAKRDATSVSGISSGAYMAGQFEMAHAKDVVGIGIIAGGPYGCSESLYADVIPGPGTALLNLTKAINGCMQNALQAFGVPDPQQLAHRAERLAEHDRIDPIADVKPDRIYLFTGTNDHTVVRPIVAAARRFYEDLGVPAAQIALCRQHSGRARLRHRRARPRVRPHRQAVYRRLRLRSGRRPVEADLWPAERARASKRRGVSRSSTRRASPRISPTTG